MSSRTVEHADPAASAEEAIAARAVAVHGGIFVDASCRALDIVGSLILLVLLSPLILAIAIIVRLDSPGPAVFRQQRIGRGGKPFTVNKFRSMYTGSAHDTHRAFVLGLINGEPPRHENPPLDDEDAASKYYKMMADPRVTRAGRLLRRSSLDERP